MHHNQPAEFYFAAVAKRVQKYLESGGQRTVPLPSYDLPLYSKIIAILFPLLYTFLK